MIQIKGWSSFQSYKDRKPPWIRLHKALLDNFEFQTMSANARALLPMFWLLASEDVDPVSGLIQYGYEKIAFRLRLPLLDIKDGALEMEKNGFIEIKTSRYINQSKKSLDGYETVTPETETETENREEKILTPLSVKPDEDHRKYDSVPYVDLVGAYHKLCPSLPKVREMTDKRRKALKIGWKKYEKHEGGFPAVLDTLFKKAEQSDFLTGRSDGWGGAGFDWLLKEANMVKVIEGNYDNKDAIPTKNKFGKAEPQHHGAAYKMMEDLTNG
jgi:hypothetical protein